MMKQQGNWKTAQVCTVWTPRGDGVGKMNPVCRFFEARIGKSG
ncbi:hypothetical protein [Paraburkholderia unamae]|nr:hypothetical protein [Paraburkholderia unamae]